MAKLCCGIQLKCVEQTVARGHGLSHCMHVVLRALAGASQSASSTTSDWPYSFKPASRDTAYAAVSCTSVQLMGLHAFCAAPVFAAALTARSNSPAPGLSDPRWPHSYAEPVSRALTECRVVLPRLGLVQPQLAYDTSLDADVIHHGLAYLLGQPAEPAAKRWAATCVCLQLQPSERT